MNDQSLQELVLCWKTSPYPCTKISSYFPAYVDLFSHLRHSSCTFIETGVLDGGSLFMWRNWLGPDARIIGIDLNPDARQWKDHGFEIYIGDQGDPSFWKSTLKKIGAFDVLLDDGGHQSFQQIVTVVEAIRFSSKPCLVVVEDTMTSFLSDFSKHGQHSFLEYSKAATDLLTGRSFSIYPPGRRPADFNELQIDFFKHVFNIQFFNGIVAFQLDAPACIDAEVVRNKERQAALDYRYQGTSSAKVAWPSISGYRVVTVDGGYTPPNWPQNKE